MALQKQIETEQGVVADYIKMTELHIAQNSTWARLGLFMNQEKGNSGVAPFMTFDFQLPYHPQMNREQAWAYIMSTMPKDGDESAFVFVGANLNLLAGAQPILDQGQAQAKLLPELQALADGFNDRRRLEEEARKASEALRSAQEQLNGGRPVQGQQAPANVRS